MDKDTILVKDIVFPVFQMKGDFRQSRFIEYMEDEMERMVQALDEAEKRGAFD